MAKTVSYPNTILEEKLVSDAAESRQEERLRGLEKELRLARDKINQLKQDIR
jgi:hypothetical protein